MPRSRTMPSGRIRPSVLLSVLAAGLLAASSCGDKEPKAVREFQPVHSSRVDVRDGFWGPVLRRHREVVVPRCIGQVEVKTGRMANFEAAASGGEFQGRRYDDSDVYKVLEGMARSLDLHPDAELEAKCDEWIAKIAAAQRPDGYLDTYFILARPDGRWTEMDGHEMYCAGHLIEAGAAYYHATGKRSLLDVARRMADHCMEVFGPEGRHWVPGHQEIELAMVKLYEVTGERKYLDFARWLLGERGRGHGVFKGRTDEATLRYHQDFEPVEDLSAPYGHAVRAAYMFSGMADVAAYDRGAPYSGALAREWEAVTGRHMYITGGIGRRADVEGFGEDYDLPNETAYCETCASVGMVMWGWRMAMATGESSYMDVVERCLYNGVLAGVSLDGERFFYDNPLESKGDHHRQEWFGCACCPSQICRFLPSVGGYAYGTSAGTIWVNLFMEGTLVLEDGFTLVQRTSYPWDGKVAIQVGDGSSGGVRALFRTIRVRIPGWCGDYRITVNGGDADYKTAGGYAVLPGPWLDGDEIILDMLMPVRRETAAPEVEADAGKCALARGPVVYCMEEADNPAVYDGASLDPGTRFEVEFDPGLLGGVSRVTAVDGEMAIRFVPYFAWDNRSPGRMKVWVDAK